MKDTIVVSIALTSPDLQPAYELSLGEGERACNLLSVGPLNEKALVDVVSKLFQTAQEAGLLTEPYSPCLFAGRLERV